MVSVVCVAFNQEKYIGQAIESFLMQKHDFDIEIIIHDDASTDTTQAVIKSYVDKYPNLIKTIFQKENIYSKGDKPWKHCLQKAKGKYIALCDGDDYWCDPLKLQKQVAFLEANPEYVITSHNAKLINEKGDLVKAKQLKLTKNRSYSGQELKNGAFLLTLTVMFKNVINEFPKEFFLVSNGDTFLIALLGNHGKGYFTTDVKDDVYRVHSRGVWSMIDECEKFKKKFQTFFLMHQYFYKTGDATSAQHYIGEMQRSWRILFQEYTVPVNELFVLYMKSKSYFSIKNNKLLIKRMIAAFKIKK